MKFAVHKTLGTYSFFAIVVSEDPYATEVDSMNIGIS